MAAIALTSVVSQSTNQVSSPLEGETVILELDNNKYFQTDETGNEIWSKIEEPISVDKLIADLADQYEATAEEVESDVMEFLAELLELGLIDVE